MMSRTKKRWLSTLLAISALTAGLGAMLLAKSTEAGQVGVAAAVKPDAFSGGSEIKIGASVFYNQRINTSGSGLVQVLLVDGSTFTVGPGSDLVIDKFVYDPQKNQGEVVASFSKGVLRFVGGKISKNEGGVTVNTPSGALAIRGGMFQGTPHLFSFLFGVEMKFTGKNGQVNRVYQPGYTLDLKGGFANIRPTTAQDTAFFMKALSGGGKVVVATPNGPKEKPDSGFLKSTYLNEIQQEGTQTIIIGQLANQEDNPNPPTPFGVSKGGYAGGIFTQTGDSDDVTAGSLANCHCTEIVVTYDKKTNTFSGAKFVLYADQGGGLKIRFEPFETDILSDNQPSHESLTNDHPVGLDGFVAVGHASIGDPENPNIGAISVYHDLDRAGQLSNPASHVSGDAYLYSGSGTLLCENCGFIKWGAWTTDVSFDNKSGSEGQTNVNAIGFWVAGNMTSTADLGDLRNSGARASYSGKAWASVANNLDGEGWSKYNASGNMDMNWSFGRRKGNLTISNFDAQHFDGVGLNFAGKMKTPGQVVQNQFTGPLSLQMSNLPASLSGVQGYAQGSFVKGPNSRVQGVIGNWGVGNDAYKATGIFAGSKGVPQ
jgi:hypothetical protein